jgi:hypothetical protein
MRVYDCDDEDQFADLSKAVGESNLEMTNQLQAFAPDDLVEAANRGFRPVAPRPDPDTSYTSD